MLSKRTIQIRSRPHVLYGPPDDPYFNAVSGDTDPEHALIFEALVRPNYCCVDIGANVGLKALYLAQLARKVIAVEPSPTVFPALAASVKANGYSNVLAVNCAVSSQSASLRFLDHSAYSHVTSAGGIEVQAKTLPEIVKECGEQTVDLVKIDAEGHEPEILQGALELVRRSGAVILLEVNAWMLLGVHRRDPFEFLTWITEQFSHCYLVRRGAGVFADALRQFDRSTVSDVLHTNLVLDACVSDLVVTTDPSRLVPNPFCIEADALRRKLAAVTAERDAMRQSSSWRLTQPLREGRRLVSKIWAGPGTGGA
jgi:FkbM family methyltransferase